MKKLVAAVLMLVLVGLGKFAQADYETFTYHGLYLEGQANAFIPTKDNFDTSFHANGRVGFQFNDFWALEAEGGWSEVNFADIDGDVRILPVIANLKLTLFPGQYVIDPYLFAGGGWSFNDSDVVNVDDDFVIQAGAGVKFHITEALSIYGEGRYFYHRPDVEPAVFGDTELELDAVIVGGGATFRF